MSRASAVEVIASRGGSATSPKVRTQTPSRTARASAAKVPLLYPRRREAFHVTAVARRLLLADELLNQVLARLSQLGWRPAGIVTGDDPLALGPRTPR
jgi:hypothetical protein